MARYLSAWNSLDTFTKVTLGTYVALSGLYAATNTEGKQAQAKKDLHEAAAHHHDAHVPSDVAEHNAHVKAHAAEAPAMLMVPHVDNNSSSTFLLASCLTPRTLNCLAL